MNITSHRPTLMVCVLAGALALAIALVAAKDILGGSVPGARWWSHADIGTRRLCRRG